MNFSNDKTKNDLLKHSGLMFLATVVSGSFNFLLQIVANRELTETDFSFMYSLFTVSMIFGVLGMSVLSMVSKQISHYRANAQTSKVSYLLVHTLGKISLIALAAFITFLPFAGKIASVLNRPDAVTAVMVTGFLMCLSVVVPVIYGALQGMERFKQWSLSMIIFAVLRLAIGCSLIYLGFNVTGVISASIIAYILIFALIFYWLKDVFFGDENPVKDNLISYYKTSWWIVIAFFFNYIICFIDILMVQHYFLDGAPVYSSASLLGRTIFYLPMALAAGMFPKVSAACADKKSPLPLLKTTLKYSFTLCFLAAVILFTSADFLVGLILKSAYSADVPALLRIFVFAFIPYALITILVYYNIAAHRIKVLWVLLGASIMHVILLNFFRQSLFMVIKTLAVSGVIICAALLIFTFGQKKVPEIDERR